MTKQFLQKDELDYTENVCIITDKVYAHCQQRECFPNIKYQLCGGDFKSIKFRPGFIVDGTLVITPIPCRPNFKRVRFTLRIPFKVKKENGEKSIGYLPDILKDIVLFIPEEVRDEFEFKIVVETQSKVLGYVQECGNTITFAAGVFIIVKVVGRVQLLIPAFGFCPEPPECEEFEPDGGVCDNFEYEDFPEFYPPQYEDIQW